MSRQWMPFDVDAWPEVVELLAHPWPEFAAVADLRWHYQTRAGMVPGRSVFARRWGWGDYRVRALLRDEERWKAGLRLAPTSNLAPKVDQRCTNGRRSNAGNDAEIVQSSTNPKPIVSTRASTTQSTEHTSQVITPVVPNEEPAEPAAEPPTPQSPPKALRKRRATSDDSAPVRDRIAPLAALWSEHTGTPWRHSPDAAPARALLARAEQHGLEAVGLVLRYLREAPAAEWWRDKGGAYRLSTVTRPGHFADFLEAAERWARTERRVAEARRREEERRRVEEEAVADASHEPRWYGSAGVPSMTWADGLRAVYLRRPGYAPSTWAELAAHEPHEVPGGWLVELQSLPTGAQMLAIDCAPLLAEAAGCRVGTVWRLRIRASG